AARIRRTTSLLIGIPKANSICLAMRGHPISNYASSYRSRHELNHGQGLLARVSLDALAKTAICICAEPEPDGNSAVSMAGMRSLIAINVSAGSTRTESGDQPIPDAEIGARRRERFTIKS